jgi:hypothetical protein
MRAIWLDDLLMDVSSSPLCSTTHGGQIFSVPLFLSMKALFLRASAFFLVDATGQISPILSSETKRPLWGRFYMER